MFEPDRILDQILEIFVEYDTWLTFRQLAYRVTGDPSNKLSCYGFDLIDNGFHVESKAIVVTQAPETPTNSASACQCLGCGLRLPLRISDA